jgi:hypothetical protein
MGRKILPSIFESHLPGNTPVQTLHSGPSCPHCLLGKGERKRLHSVNTIHDFSIKTKYPLNLLKYRKSPPDTHRLGWQESLERKSLIKQQIPGWVSCVSSILFKLIISEMKVLLILKKHKNY